jgi:hypothetical protein
MSAAAGTPSTPPKVCFAAADVSIFHQFGAGDILTRMEVRVELLPGVSD